MIRSHTALLARLASYYDVALNYTGRNHITKAKGMRTAFCCDVHDSHGGGRSITQAPGRIVVAPHQQRARMLFQLMII